MTPAQRRAHRAIWPAVVALCLVAIAVGVGNRPGPTPPGPGVDAPGAERTP
ncbi:MAG: hypothetical protein KIT54_11210 [Phycisphaeraceae bacterium]|nr:hypothetical protein [Phycisphaeraceae bacterium]